MHIATFASGWKAWLSQEWPSNDLFWIDLVKPLHHSRGFTTGMIQFEKPREQDEWLYSGGSMIAPHMNEEKDAHAVFEDRIH